MIRLSCVKSEIEKSLRGEASAKNVYDLAALLTVRAYLAAPSESVQADLDKTPKLYNKKGKKEIFKKIKFAIDN